MHTSFRDYFGDVPVFLSGGASQRSYLVVEQTAKELMIYSVRNNNWKEKKLEKCIELNIAPRGMYQIVTALNNKSVVDLNVSNSDVTLYDNHYGKNQRWEFVYDGNKAAHQIRSVSNPHLILVWIDVDGSRKVMAHVNEYKEEHYWILEDPGDSYYIIKNKKNPNLVLNVEGGNTTSGTNINVHEKNGKKAQKFKLSSIPDGRFQIVTALNNKSVVDLNVSDNDVTLYDNHYGDLYM
ncbi:RICIN domain-containing protein [Bacillus mycoides]|uniref:RICIN domain-containing protein n=1 Tax=Bacillus mycoides TaxID=1405 RepID=UPI003D653481